MTDTVWRIRAVLKSPYHVSVWDWENALINALINVPVQQYKTVVCSFILPTTVWKKDTQMPTDGKSTDWYFGIILNSPSPNQLVLTVTRWLPLTFSYERRRVNHTHIHLCNPSFSEWFTEHQQGRYTTHWLPSFIHRRTITEFQIKSLTNWFS